MLRLFALTVDFNIVSHYEGNFSIHLINVIVFSVIILFSLLLDFFLFISIVKLFSNIKTLSKSTLPFIWFHWVIRA